MMQHLGPLIAACIMVLAACTPPAPPPDPRVPMPVVPTQGRVTLIDTNNAPEVVAVPPARIVPAPPFVPVGADGTVAVAIAHTRTYTTDDGLPLDYISCTYRASNGMLWFGTNGGGVTRYDGRSFTNFTMNHGLPDNTIMALGGDRNGNIWIGTSTGGLCRYDGHRFTTFSIGDGTGLNKGIHTMIEDKDGIMWFGSRGQGVFRHDPSRTHQNGQEEFTIMPVIHPQGKDHVRALSIDNSGALWAATGQGLARWDGSAFRHIVPAGVDLTDVSSMVADGEGALWLGRYGGGLTRYTHDESRTLVTHYPLLPGERVSVYGLIRDAEGGCWVASRGHGALNVRPNGSDVLVSRRLTVEEGIASNDIASLLLDQHGDLWLGTSGAGIIHYRGDAFSSYRGFAPVSIAEDPKGTLWVGTNLGLARFDGHGFQEQKWLESDVEWNHSVSIDPQGHVGFGKNVIDRQQNGSSWFDGTHYRVISVPDNSPYQDMFWTMHDRRGGLWLGGRRGAEHYADGRRTIYTTRQGLSSDMVLALAEDEAGSIWVGGGEGFCRIDSASITAWTMKEGLPNNIVWCVIPEPGGTIWVCTLAGICRFDGTSFLTINTQHGLPDDNINQAFLARDGKALYVGTLNGIGVITGWRDASGTHIPFNAVAGLPNDSVARLSPEIEVFNTSTGFPLKDVQTAQQAIFEDSKGILWISNGSEKTGLVRLDREALRPDTTALAVQLLSVSPGDERLCWYGLLADTDSITLAQQESRVFGRALNAHERSAQRTRFGGVSFSGITQYFPVPEDLVLDHVNNRIAFTFVGIETARSEVVEYQCMLEGYDKDWTPPTHVNTATYGNISEGDHTFKVKAKNPGGVWSVPLEYRFSVLPPWYRAWWAYVLYVLVAVGSVLLYIRSRTSGLQKQKELLERTVAERTTELSRAKDRAEHSERVKEQFLANMSHEIRTPMNAIMGMTGILRRNTHLPEQEKYLNAVSQSSENLLVILNDILDLSKLEAGKTDLERLAFDPRTVVGNVRDILRFKAEEKGLSLDLKVAVDVPPSLMGDPTRLNQIVLNLAGNAIKFTEHGGVTIRVSARDMRADECVLAVDVIDTGIGIPGDRLDRIFEEFTQAYSDTTRKYGGTGLGLSISKRLAEMQGGSLTVRSEQGKGSTFTVTIRYAIGQEDARIVRRTTGAEDPPPLCGLRILLAEDNDFNAMVAQDELADAIPGVQVDVAVNGKIAVKMAQARNYDVILMDVQMPEMNGYDATKAIRALGGEKARTPILAMTANVMKDEVDRCTEAGMVGFVPKPFKREELVNAIRSALGQGNGT